MDLESYRIVFDHPTGTYFAGQTVTGRVDIELRKLKELAGIYLCIKGEAQVRWIDGNREYNGQEEYLKLKLYCLGDENHARVTLPIGNHVYPFSFPLPPTLPSSFESPLGNIRYTVKVVVERPWKWNHEIKGAFTVISPYDLNTSTNLMSPLRVVDEDYPCCCKSFLFTAVMMVQKTGYVCGEKIPVIIEIDNRYNIDIPSVDLTFQQVTFYSSQHPKTKVNEDVVIIEKRKLGSILQNNSKSWTHNILIPPLAPSNVGSTSIIKTDYQICVDVVQLNTNKKIMLLIPITIGTIPFVGGDALASDPGLPPPDYDTSVSEKIGPPQAGWNNNSATLSTSRPGFGEYTFFNAASIQDTDDNEYTMYNNNLKGFSPHYSVYNISM